MIHTGDCIQVMAGMEPDSVDAVVTDPPYGLAFMGKAWDMLTPQRFGAWCEAWGREALRVTKPGGYLLAFGGTRTHHRLVCGLEDAGWIIRDELDWIYASGFPKGKANLKPAHEPIVLARKPGPLQPLAIDECRIEAEPWVRQNGAAGSGFKTGKFHGAAGKGEPTQAYAIVENPTGGRWPSNVLLSEPALFDERNPEVVGSGALGTDNGAARQDLIQPNATDGDRVAIGNGPHTAFHYGDTGGYSRFFIVPKADRADREPVVRGQLNGVANDWHPEPGEYDDFIHPAPEAIGAWLREQREAAGLSAKELCARIGAHGAVNHGGAVSNWEAELNRPTPDQWLGLRDALGFDDRYDEVMTATRKAPRQWASKNQLPRENAHPTVKPVDLMRHLVRLVTPSGGTVLDPFLGSGSTAIAAELEGFAWLGIEKEPEYVAIAEARLHGTQRGLGLDVPAPTAKRSGGPDTYVADTEYLNATRPKARYQPWKEMDGRTPKLPEEAES